MYQGGTHGFADARGGMCVRARACLCTLDRICFTRHTCLHESLCVYTHTSGEPHASWQPCICIYIYVYIYMYIYVCMCVYVYMYICICIYVYIGGRVYPYRRMSSLRALTGLGQRSWALVVPRPWTVPPPLGIPNTIP